MNKKLKNRLIIFFLVCSIFSGLLISPITVDVVLAAEGDYTGVHWDTAASGNADAYGITSNGTFIFIVDFADTDVYNYSMAGVYQNKWDTAASGNADPVSITTNDTYFWITDEVDDEVYRYYMNGTYIDSWDTAASGNGAPYGITTDDNYFYVGDNIDKEVYRYQMDGTYVDSWDTSGCGIISQYGITTDGNYTWIVDYNGAEVYKYETDGTYTGIHWDTAASGNDAPTDIRLQGNFFYILDLIDDEVYEYEGPPAPPNPPTAFTSITIGTTAINVSWNKVVNANFTHLVRKTGSFPTDRTDGTPLYNGTGSYYLDTPLTSYQHYYYKAWSFNNSTCLFSTSVATDNHTGPANPTNIYTSVIGANLNISWTKGTDADYTRLQRNVGSYPTSPYDGTNLYNGTGIYDISALDPSYAYTIYSYDVPTGLFSSGVAVDWGLLTVNCYNEETNASLIFDLFISNYGGTETYYRANCNNPINVSVGDLPLGESNTVKVSAASNYENKSEYFSGYTPDQNTTTTYVVLLVEPTNKYSTNLTARNSTSSVNFYPPFILNSDAITILPNACGQFDEIWVNYTHGEYVDRFYNMDFETNVFYTLNAYLPPVDVASTYLYKINVVGPQEEFTSPPINDARLVFKRYLPFVGGYTTISSIHTDANGQAWITLIPNELYKINITKTGYITSLVDMIPIDSETPSDREYTFRILPEPSVVVDIELFYDTITFTAVMNDAGYLNDGNITITYDDSNGTTTNTQIYLFDVWNNTVTFLDLTVNVSEQNFTYRVSGINTTHLHYATLYFNNSNLFDVSSPITITILPLHMMHGTRHDLNERIINIIGPFGWDIYGDTITVGWHNVIALFLPFLFLLGFGVFNIGVGILACGVSMGFVQIVYAMWFTNSLNPLFILLCPVVVAVAFLVLWTKGKGEDAL